MKKRNIKSRIYHILWKSDLEATRLYLSLGSLLWAALLFWPGELFSPTRKTYELMARIAPEEVWGALFLLQGSVMLYSLLWGYRTRLSFYVDGVLGVLLWTVSTMACFIAHFQSFDTYQPPAAMSYEVIAAISSWWYLVRYSLNNKGNDD